MGQIDRIKKKLEKLKSLDKRFSIYGANRHKYEFNRKLTEVEIHKIEKGNNIFLSDEYKQILKHLGNGGAGCGNGLEKLSLNKVHPPYRGTKYILRNCENPNQVEGDMVNLNDISGYINLFDYGCGIETSLIATGEEKGELIFYDCDGRFEKRTDKSLLEIYEDWLDESLANLTRIKNKLLNHPIDEVIDSEWKSNNFLVKDMVHSIMNIDVPKFSPHTDEYKLFVEEKRKKWIINANDVIEIEEIKQIPPKKWWEIWKK